VCQKEAHPLSDLLFLLFLHLYDKKIKGMDDITQINKDTTINMPWGSMTIINYKVQENGAITGDSIYVTSMQQNRVDNKEIKPYHYVSFLLISLLLIIVVYRYLKNKKKIKALESQIKTIKQAMQVQAEERDNERRKMFSIYITNTPVYEKIQSLIKAHIDDIPTGELLQEAAWENLKSEINKLDDNFCERLKKDFTLLKPEDIKYCCLFKLGLKASEIACLMGRTPNMIHKRRKLISERLGLDKTSFALEEFLYSF